MSNGLSVAVIGESGIGQHHARWHTVCGSEVVAFVGTSDASVMRTLQRLADYFGFQGRGYKSVPEMLAQEQPDIVTVGSPHNHHKEHALSAIEAGAHVLCEKPLFWDEDLPPDRILADGSEITAAALASDRLFGVTAQYPVCLPMYRELYRIVRGDLTVVESVDMEMEVQRLGERKLFDQNWIDVASRPLSLVIAFLGRGAILPDTAECCVEEDTSRASLVYLGDQGEAKVAFTIRDITDGVPLRRFGVNGLMVDWDGFADAEGVYRATLRHGEHSVSGDDFLHMMIQAFMFSVLEGRTDVLLGAPEALLNLEMQVELLRLARTGADAV